MNRQPIRLVALDREETRLPGCIGFDNPSGPIAGFAEIDPNGMFASPDDCDHLAQEVARRWNAHDDLLNFVKEALDFANSAGDFYMAEQARNLIAKVARTAKAQ